jgi:hypothetical protein
MSISTASRRLSFAGTLAASAIGLAMLTVPLAPATAQYVGFSVGPFGFGVGAPATAYYYPPAYPYAYYAPTYYYQGYYPGYYPRYYYPRW